MRAIGKLNWDVDTTINDLTQSAVVCVIATHTYDEIMAGIRDESLTKTLTKEVRRELQERYGEKKLYEGGLSVRTTLDPKIQLMARKALVDGRVDEASTVLADALGLKPAEIRLLSGETASRKKFLVQGVALPELQRRIVALLRR